MLNTDTTPISASVQPLFGEEMPLFGEEMPLFGEEMPSFSIMAEHAAEMSFIDAQGFAAASRQAVR